MRKVLIVEDDAVVAAVYRGQLERHGFSVEIATDGQSGFYRVHETRPDAVLLDLMLPEISGLEILQKIRAQAQFKHLPVIIFSNSFLPSVLEKAREAGATRVLNKASASAAEVIESIKSACVADPSITSPASDEPAPLPKTAAKSAEQGPPLASADLAAMNAQAELRAKFLGDAPRRINALRKLFQETVKTERAPEQLARFMELYWQTHSVTSHAAIAGLNCVAQICAALEALLKELHDRPKYINASSLRTVAQTMDFLGQLAEAPADSHGNEFHTSVVLVVDDDVISRQTVCAALEKANLRSVSVENPELALKLAEENTFDLVLSDVEMPEMNGFDLCGKIRAQPANETTPFVFVTSLSNFDSRARSTLSGGNDLIGKPFLLIELAVKALIHVLKKHRSAAGH